MSRQADPRDKVIAKIISRYRKQTPGTPYHEAVRAITFDEPWASETRSALATTPPVQQALSRRNGGDSRLCSELKNPPLDGAKGG